jgi:hypothetical protein
MMQRTQRVPIEPACVPPKQKKIIDSTKCTWAIHVWNPKVRIQSGKSGCAPSPGFEKNVVDLTNVTLLLVNARVISKTVKEESDLPKNILLWVEHFEPIDTHWMDLSRWHFIHLRSI